MAVAALAALGTACADDDRVLERWTLRYGDVERAVSLPAHFSDVLPDRAVAYTLETTVALPPEWRGQTLNLSVPYFSARARASVDGEPLPTTSNERGFRGTEHSWLVPPDRTKTDALTIALEVDHRWTQSAWFDTVPRLTRGPLASPVTRAVAGVRQWAGAISVGTLSTIAFTNLMLYLFDRKRRDYAYLGIQTALPIYYCLFSTGATQHISGSLDVMFVAWTIGGALIMGVYAIHEYFQLPRPSRLWAATWLVNVIAGITTVGEFRDARIPSYIVVATLAVCISYLVITMARIAWQRRDTDSIVHLSTWSVLAVTAPVDGLAWVGGGELAGGIRPAVIGLGIFALLQFIALSRGLLLALAHSDKLRGELESRMHEVEGLNVELRQQIAERSRDLSDLLGRMASGTHAELELGGVVDDRYSVVQRVGAGASGTVYEVRRLTDGRRMAMKVLTEGGDIRKIARFAREARLACEVQHRNVVEVADVGVSSSGFMYLILEYVEGLSLKETSHRYRELPWSLDVLEDVAHGLGAIHAAGIVHRDLKPANVLLAREGSIHCAKLADFGIAGAPAALPLPAGVEPEPPSPERTDEGEGHAQPRGKRGGRPGGLTVSTVLIREPGSGEVSPAPSGFEGPLEKKGSSSSGTPSGDLTKTGILMGTPKYMAPELADGRRNDDPATDIFSFGIMAYEILTGELPPGPPPLFAALHGTPRQPAPPIRESNAGVPDEVAAIVDRAMSHDPSQRPTADELAAVFARDRDRRVANASTPGS